MPSPPKNPSWQVIGTSPAQAAPGGWAVTGETPVATPGVSPDLASMLHEGLQRIAQSQPSSATPTPPASLASRAWAVANHPLLSGEQMVPGLGLIEMGANAVKNYLGSHGHPTAANAAGVYAGAAHGMGDMASGMTSPVGVGLGLTGLGEESIAAKLLGRLGADPAVIQKAIPLASRLMSLGFSAQNFAGAYRDIPQFRQAVAANDYEQAARIATGMLGQTALGTLAAFHGVASHAIPESSAGENAKPPEPIAPSSAVSSEPLAPHSLGEGTSAVALVEGEAPRVNREQEIASYTADLQRLQRVADNPNAPANERAYARQAISATEELRARAQGVNTPSLLAEQSGLIHKGEVVPGTGVHQFEHPDYPGLTMALDASKLSTPDALRAQMNAKLTQFRANPSTIVQSILARGDAQIANRAASQPAMTPANEASPEAGDSASALPQDVRQRIAANAQALRELADPTKINSTSDVSSVLQDASAKLARNTDPRILESLSIPLRQQLARELGMTEDELLQTSIGQAANAETVQAARDLLANSRANVLAAAQESRGNPDDSGKLDDFLTALARHNEISSVVRGQVAREAGRSLQAFNGGDSGAGRTLDQAARELSQMAPDAKREAARRLAMLDPSDPGAIERFAREVKPSSTADKLYEAWMNSILSGGAAVAKTFGDTLQLGSQYVSRPVAGAIDAIRSALTGAPRTRFASELIPGLRFGLPAAVRAFARTFQNEVGAIDSENEFEPRKIAIKGKLGRVVRVPSRLLAAITDFFHVANYSSELHATAWRIASQEGLEGRERIARFGSLLANPTDAMKERAFQFARTQTFQDNFQGEGWYNAAMREALKLKSNKIARWAFPFVRTPMNIVREGVRYSPLGFLGSAKGAIGDGLSGGELTDSLTKNTLGTAVYLYALDKALAGHITGAGPSDPRKRQALENTGWQPYSYLANGKYNSYRRMVPLNFVLGAAADTAEALRSSPSDPAIASKIFSGAGMAAQHVLDVPFLSSTTQLASLLEGPKQAAHVGSYELIPGFVRNTAHMLDPTARIPQTPGQEFEANIPGLTNRVPARVDLSGQPVMQPSSQLGGFNPFPARAARNDAVLAELARLGVTQTNPPKKTAAPAKAFAKGAHRPSMPISPREAQQLQTSESKAFYQGAARMMGQPQWAKMTDAVRLEALKRLREKITAARYGRLMELRSPKPSAQPAGWQVIGTSPAP
ncbi:MAG: hypothetical protein ACRD4R_08660 [Candidatus Acidiferrales bacterium]